MIFCVKLTIRSIDKFFVKVLGFWQSYQEIFVIWVRLGSDYG